MDKFDVDIQVLWARRDFSRWSIRHPVVKNGDVLAAVVTIDGGFIDHKMRKLTVPSAEAARAFDQMPKSPEFVWREAF